MSLSTQSSNVSFYILMLKKRVKLSLFLFRQPSFVLIFSTQILSICICLSLKIKPSVLCMSFYEDLSKCDSKLEVFSMKSVTYVKWLRCENWNFYIESQNTENRLNSTETMGLPQIDFNSSRRIWQFKILRKKLISRRFPFLSWQGE